MNQSTNGQVALAVIAQIDKRLERIEIKIDQVTSEHNSRIRKLETDQAESKGGWKVLAGIGSASGIIGGIISHLIGKSWGG